MAAEDWLPWADRAYFGAAIVAAIATALTVVAGIAQNRLNARISLSRDRAFSEFRIASETRTADLLRLAAEANQKTENERAARLAMEAKYAWRLIPPETASRITASLKEKIGVIRLAYIANDPESLFVANQIGTILKDANQEFYPEAETYYQRLFFGIVIPGADSAAASLREAFNAAGVRVQALDVPSADVTFGPSGLVPVATILVGAKSPPF